MTTIEELNLKFKNNENDDRLRKFLGIHHRDDIIVLCRDNQEFSNGDIVVRPDALLWQMGTLNFTVVEYKSRDLHGDCVSLYEYFQLVIESHVIECVLENIFGKSIHIEPILLYGNGRKTSRSYDYENIFDIYDAIAEMNNPLPVPGSEIARYIVLTAPNIDETIIDDSEARQRGIEQHEWLLNPNKG